LRRDSIVDIGGIVSYHCLNFLFINTKHYTMTKRKKPKRQTMIRKKNIQKAKQ